MKIAVLGAGGVAKDMAATLVLMKGRGEIRRGGQRL